MADDLIGKENTLARTLKSKPELAFALFTHKKKKLKAEFAKNINLIA